MYKVKLSACGNIDHGENPYSNIVDGRKITAMTMELQTIEECQNAVRDYIEQNGIGAGNWIGGAVYDEDSDYVGYISYNGRFWKGEIGKVLHDYDLARPQIEMW